MDRLTWRASDAPGERARRRRPARVNVAGEASKGGFASGGVAAPEAAAALGHPSTA
jgi:hypothetical protein